MCVKERGSVEKPANSMASIIAEGAERTSYSLTMLGCFRRVRMKVSRYTRSTSSMPSMPVLSTIFNAHTAFVWMWVASFTLPTEISQI